MFCGHHPCFSRHFSAFFGTSQKTRVSYSEEKKKLEKEPSVEKAVETIQLEGDKPILPVEEANQSKDKAVAEPSQELVSSRPIPIPVENSQPISSRPNQFEGQSSRQG